MRSGSAQAVAQLAVVGPVRAHPHGQRGVAARLAAAAGVLERAAQAEERVVVDRLALHHRLELLSRFLESAASEVRATQRFADRGLVRLEVAGPLERDRRGGKVARLEQGGAARVQLVHVLAALLGCLEAVRHLFSSTVPGAPSSIRSASTSSRIAPATALLGARSTRRSSFAVRIVTSLWSASNPMSAREMSFTTRASSALRASFSRARATASGPCSAAKPTTVWSGRRSLARA